MKDFIGRYWLWCVAAVVAVAVLMLGVMIGTRGNVDASDPDVDAADPITQDVAVAAASTVAAVNSYEPAVDDSPADATKRVADRVSGKYKKLAESDQPAPLPDQWDVWARSNDRVHAVAQADSDYQPPAEDATEAVVPLELEIFVWHADGDKTPLSKADVEATMVREAGIWKLADLEYVRTRQ
ncbi:MULTISPECIES: hypothetical protein [Corynebacterium]|uniref:hypothetical protein n=1 Tax=Corynebacterium TaxID=1716 RepID=UPI00124C8E7C|nr:MULTISPECIES: hypothetical protein [Corynebacterium]